MQLNHPANFLIQTFDMRLHYYTANVKCYQVSSLRDSSLPPAVRRCLVVSAGIAACGGNARTHHQTERVAASGNARSKKRREPL